MTTRVVLALVVVVVAVGVAAMLRRRAPSAPTPVRAAVPARLDRRDFTRPSAAWLVVLFSATTCQSCAEMRAKVAALASDVIAVEEVEHATDPDLHRRYGIDAVPLVVVADAHGTTRASFAGPTPATELWATLAALRGTTDDAADDDAADDDAADDDAADDDAAGDDGAGEREG